MDVDGGEEAEGGTASSAWYWGAIINVAGCIAINLGTNVMKLGHNKRAALDMEERKKPGIVKFREWQIGVFLFAAGNIANFVSFGFAAQSLLAALGSIQFVTNVIFASTVLKEKITIYILLATALIITGCILLVVFGDHSSAVYTGQQLLALYNEPVYIVYLCLGGAAVVLCYIVYLRGLKITERGGAHWAGWAQVLPITYSLFSALIGTQSVLFSKSLSVLIRATFDGDNQMGNWYTWVVLVSFLISAGFWMTRLNKGLRMFPAMIIVPLLQICWTLFSILEGLLYFEEYKGFTPLKAGMFSLGVAVIFVGVYLLTKSGSQKPKPAEYDKVDDAAQQELSNDATERERDQDHETLLGRGQASSSSPMNPGTPLRTSRELTHEEQASLTQRVKDLSLRVRSDFGIELDRETLRNTFGLGPSVAGSLTIGNVWDPHQVCASAVGSPRRGAGAGSSPFDNDRNSMDMEFGLRGRLETIKEMPTPAPSSPDPSILNSRAGSFTLTSPVPPPAPTPSPTPAHTPTLLSASPSAAALPAATGAGAGTGAGTGGLVSLGGRTSSGSGGVSPVGPSRGSSSPIRGSPLGPHGGTGSSGAGGGAGSVGGMGGVGGMTSRAGLDAMRHKLLSAVEENLSKAKVKVDEAVTSATTRLGLGQDEEARGLRYQALSEGEGGSAERRGRDLEQTDSIERPLNPQDSTRSQG